MNFKRLLFIVLFSFVFMYIKDQYCFAEEQVIELSLKECVDQVLVKNLNFKSSYLGLRLGDLSVVQAESKFDPSLSMNMSRGQSQTPTFYEYYKVSSIESKSTQLNLTLDQNLTTGANWGVGLYNTLSESNIEVEKNYTSYFGFNVSQPLLKGFGKKVNYSNVYITRLNRETTVHDLERGAIELIYEVQRAYWNLVYAWESLRVMELSVHQADSLLAYNRKGLELGVLTETDVLEAESMLLSRRQDVLDQTSQIRESEDVLRRLLNLTSDEDWKGRIVPTDKPEVTDIDLDVDANLVKATELRPDYIIARKTLEEYELYHALSKNSMLPNLNLSARYNINGSGKTYSKNLRDMGDFDQYGWNVGLMFSYPLKNRDAKADYEKKQIEIRRANLNIDDLKSRIMTEIRAGIRNVQIARERIDVARLSVDVDELKLKKEEERFRNQLTSSYYVLQFQRDLANSRNLYHKALMDYTMAIVELQRARGTLLRDLNISILSIEN